MMQLYPLVIGFVVITILVLISFMQSILMYQPTIIKQSAAGFFVLFYLDNSQATRPLSSITSAAVQYPSRRRTRFLHLSSVI